MLKQVTKVFAPRQYERFFSHYPSEVLSCQEYPKEEGIIKSSQYQTELTIPQCSIHNYVFENFQKWANKTAVVCGLTGQSYSYSELRDSCSAFAFKLRKVFSLQKNDTVGVCLSNSPEFVISALGILESGCIVSTYNPIYTAHEISIQILDSNTKLIIGNADNYTTLIEATKLAKRNIPVVCVKGNRDKHIFANAINFSELANSSDKKFYTSKEATDFHETAFIPYSSGTTGLPKGVCLTHRNIISNSEMIGCILGSEPLALPTTNNYQECLPCVLPFFHIYGWTTCFISKLRLGCKLVTLPSFKPDSFLKCLEVHKGTLLHLVPPIAIFLGNFSEVKGKHVDTLRIIMSGAAPLSAKDVEKVKMKASRVNFSQGYGLTESSPVALMQAIGSTNFASVGYPSPATEAKIIRLDDPNMEGIGPNESGEICVRGAHLMKGYLNNKEATDSTIVKGWLKTGDIGYYDDNNQFYITDRLKELIKVKGYQVAPAELEAILRSHPKVLEAAVIGVPNEKSGEAPRGYVVAKPNEKLCEKELQNFVTERVAPYKKLDEVVITDSIPKNATGKILRRELKKKFGFII